MAQKMVISPKKEKRGSEESEKTLMSDFPTGADRVNATRQLSDAPWPEWNDADIVAEKWIDAGYTSISAHIATDKLRAAEVGFEIPIGRRCMPASIPVYEWRRALSVNRNYHVLPEDESVVDLDLVSSNAHILHSDAMRHIVASITNLHHYAAIKPFDEAPGENFVPNGGGIWKPWNHVYAMCKAGKGTTHKPGVNQFGKYVVRLHFLGEWRRITVDDLLPLDEYGRILLPTTSRNELWPLLLAKAILNVAALTWTPEREVVEMNAVCCLTGWFVLDVECCRVAPKDVWRVCQKALMFNAEDGARYAEESRTSDPYQLGAKLPASMATGWGDRTDTLLFAACKEIEENWGTVAVFAEMASIGDDNLDEDVGEIGPCIGHQVLFTEARIIRHGDDVGPLPLWKTFRWKKWALQKGILQPDHLVNVKCLRLFAPLKKWVVPSPKSQSKLLNEMRQEEEEEISRFNESDSKGKEIDSGKGKDKAKKAKSPKKAGSEAGSSSKGQKSASKGSSKKKSIVVEKEIRENTDPWMNFNVYGKYVSHLQLFYRASSFKYCQSTHDFLSLTKNEDFKPSTEKSEKKTPKKTPPRPSQHKPEQQLISTTKYKALRDPDYFHLTCDSVTAKKIFITVGAVTPRTSVDEHSVSNDKKNASPSYSLIVAEFVRSLEKINTVCRLNIQLVGTKTRLLQLEDGLVCLTIILAAPRHYYLQFASQSNFKFSTFQTVHELRGVPTLSMTLYGTRIFNAFANLKRCELGSPDHVQALADYHASYLPDSMATIFTSSRSSCRFAAAMREQSEKVCAGFLYKRLRQNFEQFYNALKELQALMNTPKYALEVLQTIAPEFHEQIVAREEALERPPPEEVEPSVDSKNSRHEGEDTSVAKGKKQKTKGADKVKGKKKVEDKKEESDKGKSKGDKKKTGREKKETTNKSSKSDASSVSKKSAKNENVPHVLFENQANSGMNVIKKIVTEQPTWLNYFPFRYDIGQMLVYTNYSGTAPTSSCGDWFPLARIVVNVDLVDIDVRYEIFLNSSAALYFLQIIDNDTQAPMDQVVSFVSSGTLKRNTCGFTIFAYGYCDNVKIKEHTWTILIIAREEEQLLRCYPGVDPSTGIRISIPPPSLKVQHVYGHYIPNRRATVFRCLLTVHCSQVLTLRVNLNNPKAEILVMVKKDCDDNGFSPLLYEKAIKGRAILPSMPFFVELNEGEEESRPAVFLVEGRLHGKGWDLTEAEDMLVTGIKEKVQRELLVFSKDDSSQRSPSAEFRKGSLRSGKSLPSSQEIIVQAAHWCVQLVVDAELESKVKLELNTRKAQEIRKMKEAWETRDPGRHIRAEGERQKYLEMVEEDRKREGLSQRKSRIFQSMQLRESSITAEQREEWKTVAQDYGDDQEDKRQREVDAFKEAFIGMEEEMANICQQSKRTNTMLDNYIFDVQEASLAYLQEGYNLRKACLMKRAEEKGTSVKTDKKDKKDKKDGKGKEKAKKKTK